MNNVPKIYFFTGASGAGKTAFLEAMTKEYDSNKAAFLHFDSIGVPSDQEMIKQYGSGTAWQKAMTFAWVKKMLTEYSDKKLIFFEGQTNLLFIKESCAKYNLANYKIIFLHCENKVRHLRLTEMRNQPELINNEMDNWANYLMNHAIEQNALVLDTTNKTMPELVKWYKSNLEL